MREQRMADAVAAVAAAAMRARGARRIALLDDGSPQAALAGRWLESIGPEVLVRVTRTDPSVEPLLHAAGGADPDPVVVEEALRLRARLLPDAIVANPANKTALLLAGPLPPDRLFPLGDVWAGQVQALVGGWSAPPAVAALATAAGGIEALDAALRRWSEGRDATALDALPDGGAGVRARLAAGRPDRLTACVVPKLTARTVGIDLFE